MTLRVFSTALLNLVYPRYRRVLYKGRVVALPTQVLDVPSETLAGTDDANRRGIWFNASEGRRREETSGILRNKPARRRGISSEQQINV